MSMPHSGVYIVWTKHQHSVYQMLGYWFVYQAMFVFVRWHWFCGMADFHISFWDGEYAENCLFFGVHFFRDEILL